MQSISKISGRYYLAIFVLAFATLSYQILITRFFSVMLHYHFAFAAISLAMLGLTRGAMQVYGKPDRYATERVGIEFARHASWFAISSVVAMIVFLCLRSTVHGRRGLHHAVADACAISRRVALCGRSPGRRSWMSRGDPHTAGD